MLNFWDQIAKVGIVVVLACALTACGGGGGGGSKNNPPRLRYLNASPDAGPLTFKLDSEPRASGVTYPGVSPDLDTITQSDYDVSVSEDGGNDLDAQAVGFANEKEYLVAAVGLEDFGVEFFKRLRLVMYEVNLTPPNGNRSRIYGLNGFIRVPGIDTPNIDLRTPGETPQYKIENIAFAAVVSAEIDSSTQTFIARRSGSDSEYATGTFTFEPGGVYVAVFAGIENAVGAQAPRIEFLRIN